MSFNLRITPDVATISPGGNVAVLVAVTGSVGIHAVVEVELTGLPTGITASRDKFSITPGIPQEVSLTASTEAPVGVAAVVFHASSGEHSEMAVLSFSLSRPNRPSRHLESDGTLLPTRTRFVRTGGTTSYLGFTNKYWTTYSGLTSRFFSVDPFSNRVYVLSAVTQELIAEIPVPGAFAVDTSLDGSVVYVGTQLGDLYMIDAHNLTITRRFLSAQIGPFGFKTYAALGLADGRLALLGGQGGLPGVDGYSKFALWNPNDNSIVIYTSQYGQDPFHFTPETIICGGFMGNFGGFARSFDRTKIVMASAFSDGTLCKLDIATGAYDFRVPTGNSRNFAVSPDGSKIATLSYSPDTAFIYDFNTLEFLTSFSVAGDTTSASNPAFSADSKTLFVPGTQFVFAYDPVSGTQKGWFPNIYLSWLIGGPGFGPATFPTMNAVEGTGLFVGPVTEGVAFLDSSKLWTGPTATGFTNGYLTPNTGSTAGGSLVHVPDPNPIEGLAAVYVGTKKVTNPLSDTTGITFTMPAGPPGPADIYLLTVDGGMQILPDGYSYGPSILQISADSVTTEGGLGWIFGYGLGAQDSNNIPSDLHVTVGGKPAVILGYNRNAYEIGGQPFPLQSFVYTIPSGSIGPADVTVSTSSGATTVTGGMNYLPPIERYPMAGASLAQGIYDSYRDLYYFTDTSSIRVFSRASGTSSTHPVPAPPGKSQRLWGIALSPDGTKLVVSDLAANVIYLLDPVSLSTTMTFPIPPHCCNVIASPAGLAVSDQGMVYFTEMTLGVSGDSGFYKLDMGTGTFTDYNIANPGFGTSDSYLRVSISKDNTRVYFNDYGLVFTIDTLTDNLYYAEVMPNCCYGDYDMTLSSNNTRLMATYYFYDADMNAESWLGYNNRENKQIYFLYGAKLSSNGSLLFQPMTSSFQPSSSGIDVVDARTGSLRTRVSLPGTLSFGFDSLVSNGKDNVLVAILGQNGDGGIAVLDLNSLPLPAPVNYEQQREPNGNEMRREERFRLRRSTSPNNDRSRPITIPHVPAVIPHQ